MIIDWYIITIEALASLWHGFLVFIPKLIGALIVLLIGWLIAVGIGKLVTEILKRLGFNKIFEKGTWREALEKAEFRIDASGFIGAICKWILVVVFLLAAVEILGLVQFAGFLSNVLGYLPNVVVAALIFVVAVIIAEIVEKIVRAGVERAKLGYGSIAGAIVKWSIWIFAILAILQQLRFEAADWIFELIKVAFVGIVAMAAIAFGLGGKEMAAGILDNLKKKLKE